MLQIERFKEAIASLETFYNRKFDDRALQAWYRYLDSNLTIEQFEAAVDLAICTCEFMPTAAKLVELISPSVELESLKEWEKVCVAASRGDRTVAAQLSPAGQSALRAIGGIGKVEMADEDKLVWIKKEFLQTWKTYEQKSDATPMLLAAAERNGKHLNGLASIGSIANNFSPRHTDGDF